MSTYLIIYDAKILASVHQCWIDSWRQRLSEVERNSFITLHSKGGNSGFLPPENICPNPPEEFDEFYSNSSRLKLLIRLGFISTERWTPQVSRSAIRCAIYHGHQWRNNSRKNEETESKQKQHPVVDVTGDGSKVRCCKEQYCIGTWNVRSMNQGNLEVVKQEMARVNVNILGISELKWTGMGEFNSDDHYIYYCGQ